MRIVLVSPASVTSSARSAGGVAGYVGDLARALGGLGHSVTLVSAGHEYGVGWTGRGVGPCRARWLEPADGIERCEIVNSPVLSPALWQFGEPVAELRAAGAGGAVGRVFASVLARARTDVVHVHGFEGFGPGIVGRARGAGAAVLASLHNHHPFCPQVFLMRGRRSPCVDYEGGLACGSCEGRIDTAAERCRRAGGVGAPPALEQPPWPPVQSFDELGEPRAATVDLWINGHRLWEPAGNAGPDPTRARAVSSDFGNRRRTYVRALNGCHRVLAVSKMTGDIARAMGVEPARLLVMPIGSWAAEHLSPNSDRAPAEGEGPVRLLFLGFHTYAKGLAVLVDALGLLTRAWRGRVHLAAFGAGVPAIAPRIAPIRDSLAGVELGGAYDRADVPRLVAGRHFGVVPSVWWDNGPQSAIEMRSLGLPVIGAAIGGIPDIIEDGREGLLFRANDRHDLARVLAGVIREPGLSARVRARMRPWPTMGEHAGALASVYAEALSSRRGVGSEGRG